MKRFVPFFAALSMASVATAGPTVRTISDGDVTFTRGAYTPTPFADFQGVSPVLLTDHLYAFGWFFRVAGDSKETLMPAPDTESYAANGYELQWADVGGRGLFSAVESGDVYQDPAGPGGYLTVLLGVTNLGSSPLTIDVFNYADVDINGNLNDSAAWAESTPADILDLGDAGGQFGQYMVPYFNSNTPTPAQVHFQVAPYADLWNSLTDASITNLSNTGVPFGPGDFSGAFQYSLVIPAHGYRQVLVALFVNERSYCYDPDGIFCDGFETANHAFWGP